MTDFETRIIEDVHVGDIVEVSDGTGITKVIIQRPAENTLVIKVRTNKPDRVPWRERLPRVLGLRVRGLAS